MENTYQIVLGRINEVDKFLRKLQKRARKGGMSEIFTYHFEEEVKSRTLEATTAEGDRVIHTYKFRNLVINQDVTIHEGWVPIAKIDVAAKQIKSYGVYNSQIEALGDKMWTKHCDHCGHNKIVHTAYVMHKDDQYMKVGGGCMKELAPAVAGRIAREFDILSVWSNYLESIAREMNDGPGSGGGGRGFGFGVSVDYVYDKNLLILAMRAAIEKSGGKWVTSEYQMEETRWGVKSTGFILNRGERTFDYIQNFISYVRTGDLSMIPDDSYVKSVNDTVTLVLSKYPEKMGDKLEDLKVVAENDKMRAIDIFVIKRALKIAAKQAVLENMKGSEFQGEVGSKVPLVLNLIEQKHGEGVYGMWTLSVFKDDRGNMFKKFGVVNDRFKIGDNRFQFIAPIKAFETYEDIKYTVLGGPLSKVKK